MATFYNQAQLNYNGEAIASNRVSAELNEVISASKTALNQTYTQGDRITYTLTVTNTDDVAYSGLNVSDNLGQYTPEGATAPVRPLTYVSGTARYFVNGEERGPAPVTNESPLEITGLEIPEGGNIVIVYEADVNGFAPLDTDDTIDNVATITATGLAAPVTAEESIDAIERPELSITKLISGDSFTEGDEITYTFVIENRGNTGADPDLITVTDTFDPVLTLAPGSVTYNDDIWTEGTEYSYNNGIFTVNAGNVEVPAATYGVDPATGETTVTPGTATIKVTGTI